MLVDVVYGCRSVPAVSEAYSQRPGGAAVPPKVNHKDVNHPGSEVSRVHDVVLADVVPGQLLAVVFLDDQLGTEEHARHDEQHPDDDQKPYDRQVSGPINPSTERLCAACHVLVAPSVTGP